MPFTPPDEAKVPLAHLHRDEAKVPFTSPDEAKVPFTSPDEAKVPFAPLSGEEAGDVEGAARGVELGVDRLA